MHFLKLSEVIFLGLAEPAQSPLCKGPELKEEFIEGLRRIRERANGHLTFGGATNNIIRRVCMIVVVEAEVRPVIEEYGLKKNKILTDEMMGLATAHSGTIGSFRLDVLQVAEEPRYKRHYSGPTQSGAVAALVAKLFRPDLVINFGTSGGFPNVCKVGDVLLMDSCLFLDRLRFKNVTAFEWGIWGGNTIKADRLQRDLGMKPSFFLLYIRSNLLLGLYSSSEFL